MRLLYDRMTSSFIVWSKGSEELKMDFLIALTNNAFLPPHLHFFSNFMPSTEESCSRELEKSCNITNGLFLPSNNEDVYLLIHFRF